MLRNTILLGFFAVLGGCDPSSACTEIDCESGVSIKLQNRRISLPPGVYEISVVDNQGVTVECNAVVNVDGDLGERSCTNPDAEIDLVEFNANLLIETGNLDSPIQLRVTRDGKTEVDESIKLQLEVAQPNGPECPPLCTFATVIQDLNIRQL